MITLICGHSRAGKTTYSEKFQDICPVLHLDDIHTYKGIIDKLKYITEDVVVEGVYYLPSERKQLRDSYKGYAKVIFLDTPKEIRELRMGRQLLHDTPYICPTLEEGWDEIVIIHPEGEEVIKRNVNDSII